MSKKKIFIFIATCVPVLVLDQFTKDLVHRHFQWGESVKLIPQLFSLTYVRNLGAAFGFLNQAPGWFRDPFFIIVPVVALFGVVYMLITTRERVTVSSIALSLISAGAVGNLIDRVRFGFVIDFLDFYWKDWHWPAFNVADCSIVIGVSTLLLYSVLPANWGTRSREDNSAEESDIDLSSSGTHGT